MRAALLAVLAASCHREPPPPALPAEQTARDLAAYLTELEAHDAAAIDAAAATWELTRAEWDATVVPAARPLYDEYARHYAELVPQLAVHLTSKEPIAARPHFAGDLRATHADIRTRWLLPTLYPSVVVDAGGHTLDAVFVRRPGGWGSLIGLDGAATMRIAQISDRCADYYDRAGAPGRCTDIAAELFAAAMTTDRARFDHACSLAASACGNPSP
ncbi:MAG TPA: hypothetical protein VGM88_06375 [Kofleriaceae bacterium]|jgi:hypothetical protein